MTLQEIASSYINGNHGDVKRALGADDGILAGSGADPVTIAARALDIRNYLYNNYGEKEAAAFSAWLINGYSDLK